MRNAHDDLSEELLENTSVPLWEYAIEWGF